MASEQSTGMAEAYGGPLVVKQSIYEHLEEGLLMSPNDPAVVAVHQPWDHLAQLADVDPSDKTEEHDCLVWTHSQLHRAAVKVATALRFEGLQRGSVLVTLIRNRVEWALLLYASSIVGAALAALDPGALGAARESELKAMIDVLKPNGVVVTEAEDTTAIDQALAKCNVTPKVRLLLDEPAISIAGWQHLAEIVLQTGHGQNFEIETNMLIQARIPDPDRNALVLFTSGTTSGKPKGCPRSVQNTTFALESQHETIRFDKHSRFLLSSANFRIIAPLLSLEMWKKGGAIVMPGASFTTSTGLSTIERHKITHALFPPAILHAIAADESFKTRDLTSMEIIILGGDLITKDSLTMAKTLFPSARIANAHGMTEGGGVFNWPYYECDPASVPTYGGICPLGKVAPGSRLRIYDMDENRVARMNEPGELQISAPSIIKGYLGNVSNDPFFEENGLLWFKTGDLAVMDQNGVFFITGRLNDRIKRSGVPITPAALESCIEEFTGSQTSVFGVSHPAYGQEPFAVLKKFGDKTAEGVKQQVVDVFGKDYALGGVVSLEELERSDFPTNATGKIMKITLKDIVAKHLDRES